MLYISCLNACIPPIRGVPRVLKLSEEEADGWGDAAPIDDVRIYGHSRSP